MEGSLYKNHEYNLMDLMKFIMAIAVVAIHTEPIQISDCPVYEVLVRTAVPFFFMSTSFLLFVRNNPNSETFAKALDHYIKKNAFLYLMLSIAYLPLAMVGYSPLENGIFKFSVVYVFGFIFNGGHYFSQQLWFLLAIVYSFCFFRPFLKSNKLTLMSIISVILFAFGKTLMMAKNGDILIDSAITGILKTSAMSMVRWEILTAPFYLCVGIIAAKYSDKLCKQNTKTAIIIAVISFLFAVIVHDELSKQVYFVSLFLVILKIDLRPNFIWRNLRKMSTSIYYWHTFVFFVYMLIVGKGNETGLLGFVWTVIWSVLLSIALIYFRKKKRFA